MIPLVIALVALGGPRAVLSGPEQTVVTADGHAVIHYTTEGVDAVDPAWVEWAEEGLARVWAAYVDDAGFRDTLLNFRTSLVHGVLQWTGLRYSTSR